ncbi:MAG: N-acetyltransferase [Chloroflexi bacterium]|nr:MAG: N-acetyltransferase [Chloroflexota bacterium]
MLIAGPAYRIETKRTVIRCWNPADAPLFKASIDENIAHLKPFMPWAYNEPEEIDHKVERLRQFRGRFDMGQDFIYAVFNPAETTVLGGTGLHIRGGSDMREIGYWIHKDYTNQGLATEVSAALVKVAFEIDKIRRVEIHCHPQNHQSAAVPRKLGFHHEATLHARVYLPEFGFSDSMIWSLFNEDYPTSPSSKAEIAAYDAMGRKIL